MAVKKVLISLGQSNSDPIGDDASWLILHPNADLMAVPKMSITQGDLFTVPGDFYGYSKVNIRGLAMPSVKYLTFYNPASSGYMYYPGTGAVGSGGTSTMALYITASANNSLNDVVIKRGLTNTLHKITANTANTITVDPPFSPESIADESIFFNLVNKTAATVESGNTRLYFGIRWRDFRTNPASGTLLNVIVRCTHSTHANNIGVAKRIISVGTDANDNEVVVEGTYQQAPHVGDVFEFEYSLEHICDSPQVVGTAFNGVQTGNWYKTNTPTGRFDKWGYFFPWTKLEGKIYSTLTAPANKTNPFPPGFNYPNSYSVPYYWNLLRNPPSPIGHNSAYHVGLAMRLKQALGEEIYVCNLGVGSTCLAQNEQGFTFGATLLSPIRAAWFDTTAHSNWSPGASKSLYTRFLDILDTAVAAAASEGNTLEVVGVFMSQGESDTANAVWANAYEDNLRTFKSLVRQAIKDRGMYSGLAETIPWIQGKITTEPWATNSTAESAELVRDAVQKLVSEDPYMGTFETNDFYKLPGDAAHFSGAGLTQWETAAFNVWEKVSRAGTTAVDICNLALSHIGEGNKITSINPTDGSVQSSYCATFYPIARDSLLEMQQWNFAMRREALVEVTNTSTEYDYAYALPANAAKIVAVLPPDASDDYSTTFAPAGGTYYTAPIIAAGMYNPQAYSIETNEDGEQVIYTDQPNAMVRYVYRTTDSRTFSQTFVVALSWHLASMLAGPIIKGDQGSAEAKRCQQMLAAYLGKAESHDATQRNIKPEQITPWMSGR